MHLLSCASQLKNKLNVYNLFSTTPGEPNSVFSLSNHDLVSVSLLEQPMIMSDFRDYTRTHGHVFTYVPVEGEVWISQSWGGYHEWEDGRF